MWIQYVCARSCNLRTCAGPWPSSGAPLLQCAQRLRPLPPRTAMIRTGWQAWRYLLQRSPARLCEAAEPGCERTGLPPPSQLATIEFVFDGVASLFWTCGEPSLLATVEAADEGSASDHAKDTALSGSPRRGVRGFGRCGWLWRHSGGNARASQLRHGVAIQGRCQPVGQRDRHAGGRRNLAQRCRWRIRQMAAQASARFVSGGKEISPSDSNRLSAGHTNPPGTVRRQCNSKIESGLQHWCCNTCAFAGREVRVRSRLLGGLVVG